ncbi:MAG: fabD [Dehalococcoidia bacterium]|nr:fabD [Dehalococcoidia bacterium]
MSQAIASAAFRDAKMPVVANSTGVPITKSEGIRVELIDQLCSPVRWLRSVECMASAGVKTFIEIGPGQVLTGLIRRSVQDVTLVNLSNLESIRSNNG